MRISTSPLVVTSARSTPRPYLGTEGRPTLQMQSASARAHARPRRAPSVPIGPRREPSLSEPSRRRSTSCEQMAQPAAARSTCRLQRFLWNAPRGGDRAGSLEETCAR